jgi:hypothetical protein
MHKLLGALLLMNSLPVAAQQFTHKTAKKRAEKAWRYEMPVILKRIQPPVFNIAVVNISLSDNFRQQVQQSIDSLSNAGGGKIVIAQGDYLCKGPLHLKNNINLHISKGATIRFSINPKDYLPVVKVRWEGTVCYNYSPLVYACQQKNIAITGEGILDGKADKFWHAWKKQPDGNDQEKDRKF